MRYKTDKEKEIMGKVELMLRRLKINRESEGYVPLVDIIVYAYAFPDESILDIAKKLNTENHYLGIAQYDRIAYYHKVQIKEGQTLLPALVRTIGFAIERADEQYLAELRMGKLVTIIKDTEDAEEAFLSEIGEAKYGQYTHLERVLIYFVKKVLKYLKA